MTDQGPEISSKVRDVAEKSVEQARTAVGTLLDAARSAADSIQSTTGTADNPAGQAVQRGFGFAKENITAIFDFAQKLVRAPDLSEAVRMQADFARSQAETMAKQVEELQSLSTSKEETSTSGEQTERRPQAD